MDKKINVLIIDDNQFQNSGLARLLNEQKDINLRGMLTSPKDCLERLKNDTFIDLILLDIRFPNSDMDGVELALEIHKLLLTLPNWKGKAKPKILFMSVEDGGIADLSKNIHGFIPKNIGIQDLIDAIRQVYHHNAVYYPETPTPMPESHSKAVKLTPKQSKVLCAIMKSKKTKEIASNLKIKKYTVDKHRRNILNRLRTVPELEKVSQITDPRVIEYVKEHELCTQ